jgi:hypothetical protein
MSISHPRRARYVLPFLPCRPFPVKFALTSQQKVTNDEDATTASRYVQPPFPRISYEESMTRFGIDKPDLRIPFEARSQIVVLVP